MLFCASFFSMQAWSVEPDTEITNTAEVMYNVGATLRVQNTNTTSVSTTVVRTEADVSFWRYWPDNPAAIDTQVPQTEFLDAADSYQPLGDVFLPGQVTPLDLGTPVPLAETDIYFAGEPVFVQLEDHDQNINNLSADTIIVVLNVSETGDSEILLLQETGPSTGVFVGVIQSSSTDTFNRNGVLGLAAESLIQVTYVDDEDNTDEATVLVRVDPMGVVFDSQTGLPIDGVAVTLVDEATGLPAQVYGIDSVSTYPSTVITGSSVLDSGGTSYDLPPGGYRFPLVDPGDYRLDVVPVGDYQFPSTVPDVVLQQLSGAPFELSDGSRGLPFNVPVGPPVVIDVPLDLPTGELFITKTSNKTVAAIGDFVQYLITVENPTEAVEAIGVRVDDTLPVGFRYQASSVRLNEAAIDEPQISSDGRQLTFITGLNLLPGEQLNLSYVVEVTPGTPSGDAFNSAVAVDQFGVVSNIARAKVAVRDDLFRDKTFLTGRVFDGDCQSPENPEAKGLPDARIYLEDGRYVLTDVEGRWNMEGLEPGTHVVQLDKVSLPDGYEVVTCDDDTRSAGRNYSRFVDIQGGNLWRVDFVVRKIPNELIEVSQAISARQSGEKQEVFLQLQGGDISVENIRPIIILPKGVVYQADSARLDGEVIEPPAQRGQALIFSLGDEGQAWSKLLVFELTGNIAAAEKPLKAMTALVVNGETKRLPSVDLALDEAASPVSSQISFDMESEAAVIEATQRQEVTTGASKYDGDWLQTAEAGVQWLFPEPDFVPAIGSVSIRIQHYPDQKVDLTLNGRRVKGLNFYGTQRNTTTNVAVSKWQGVDIVVGDNLFVAKVLDKDGNLVERIEQIVHLSDIPAKAVFLPEKSVLVADGKTTPVVAVQLFDRHGYPVREGVVGDFEVAEPYQSRDQYERSINRSLSIEQSDRPRYQVGAEGIAYIELQPTTESGEALLTFDLENGYSEEIRPWLSAGKREWIFVGLAEGTLGENVLSGDEVSAAGADLDDGGYTDGRMAFFAKGTVKGEWLLTAAYDTDKKTENSLKQVIDPDTYYTLYGDDTYQQYDAASARKLYLKLEKSNFYAMFGDYDTGLTVTELGRYNRTLNGLKTEYRGEKFSANLFLSETEQGFVRQEIRGDGTSGKYFLQDRELIINSEKIMIETRDRFSSERILQTELLTRHLDYNIDYDEGSLFFRRPISSSDENFNPIFIVVEYETDNPRDDRLTGGGRLAYKVTEKAEVGVTGISESNASREGELYGTDIKVQISDNIELRAEVARTTSEDTATGDKTEGNAYITEIEVRSEKLENLFYVRQQDDGFGLGQQRASESGTRKVGDQLVYHFTENVELSGEAYRQINLDTDAERDVVDALIEYDDNRQNTWRAGLRYARDKHDDGTELESNQLLLGATKSLLDNRLILHANSEIGLSNNRDENPDFPNLLGLGGEYRLTEWVDLFVGHEWAWGDKADYQNTRGGIRLRPWSGAEINSSLEQQYSRDGVRLYSSVGAIQNWRINEVWTADFSIDRSKDISGDEELVGHNEDAPPAFGLTEDFTALSAALGYRKGGLEWLGRVEWRDSYTEERWNFNMGWLRQLSGGISLAAGVDHHLTNAAGEGESTDSDLRLNFAYRPDGSPWTILNRMDFIYQDNPFTQGDFTSRRMVNNLLINKRRRIDQWSLHLGLKYVDESIEGQNFDGFVSLVNGQYRRDLGKRWDIGLHGGLYQSWNSDVADIGAGLSVGHTPADNVWVSLGYNFQGFSDDDFSGADYTAKGLFLKFRIKVDQDTLSNLWQKDLH